MGVGVIVGVGVDVAAGPEDASGGARESSTAAIMPAARKMLAMRDKVRATAWSPDHPCGLVYCTPAVKGDGAGKK